MWAIGISVVVLIIIIIIGEFSCKLSGTCVFTVDFVYENSELDLLRSVSLFQGFLFSYILNT